MQQFQESSRDTLQRWIFCKTSTFCVIPEAEPVPLVRPHPVRIFVDKFFSGKISIDKLNKAVLGGHEIRWPLLRIFRGSWPPQAPMIYASRSNLLSYQLGLHRLISVHCQSINRDLSALPINRSGFQCVVNQSIVISVQCQSINHNFSALPINQSYSSF